MPRFRIDLGADVGFITSRTIRDLRHKYVFRAGGMPVLLWGEPSATYTGELMSRIQNVASLTKERLLADFPRNDVRSALVIFDRRMVRKGFGPIPAAEERNKLLRGVRQLANLLNCEETAAVMQYTSVTSRTSQINNT